MKKYFMFAAVLATAVMMSLSSCNSKPDKLDPDDPEVNPDKESVTTELTPEETKEKMMNVAKNLTGMFNTEDQKAAMQLLDDMYARYQEYSWDSVGNYFEHRYENLWRLPRYVKHVVKGKQTPAATDQSYTFSFEGESAIFEADDVKHIWKYVGKADDNSLILRCKDKDGNLVEAKFKGEGKTKEYSYTWEEYHWECPKVEVALEQLQYIRGYHNGEYREFYLNDQGWYYTDWSDYYYNEQTGEYEYRTVYVNLNEITDLYGEYYDQARGYYTSAYFDAQTGKFFYYDYEHEYKVSDGTRTVTGVLPKKAIFTLKQGSNELVRAEVEQELEKNDHAYFTTTVKVVNLSWDCDLKINSTHGSVAFNFLYGDEKLFGVAANLPSYKLIDKQDEQSYEDWIDQYADKYEDLIRQIGECSGIVDLGGEVQARLKVNNVGYAYRDIDKWDRETRDRSSRQSMEQLCQILNESQTNGIYFNSDVKQAEVRAQVKEYTENYPVGDGGSYEQRTSYDIECVLFFPSDGTTYAVEEYFNRKPFTDLQYTVEDIANAYIKLSNFLYNDVMDGHDIHF